MSKNDFFQQSSKQFLTIPNFLTIFCLNYLINLCSSHVHIKVLNIASKNLYCLARLLITKIYQVFELSTTFNKNLLK